MLKKCLVFMAVAAVMMLKAAVTVSPVTDLESPAEMPIRIGGGGGMYLFVDSGKLNIDLYAVRPERIGSVPSAVRAVLFSPDRELLADVWFPPTGKSGMNASKLTISADDLPIGIYSLMINSVQDPLGMNFQWGFTTDCQKYVIENTRGHRDARHTELITICSPEKKGNICFPVQKKSFTANIAKAVPGSQIRILDNSGKVVAETKADNEGNAAFSLPEDKSRTGLYALEFDRFQGVVEVDELTRWAKVKSGEDSSELCHWTNNPSSWFQFGIVRKMLRPFVKNLNIDKDCELEFTLFNYGSGSMLVRLTPEYAEGTKPFLTFKKQTISVPPKTQVKIAVKCAAPASGEKFTARIRAAAKGVSSYSTVTVCNDPAAISNGINIPLQIMPYRNPSDQEPYTVHDHLIPSGEPYFDSNGKAYCNNYFNTFYKEDGVWKRSVMADGSTVPRTLHSKIAFDHENRPYLLAKYKKMNDKICLLYSNDGGKTFEAVPLPIPATFADIEVFTGQNPAKNFPAIVVLNKLSGRTAESFWRQTNQMTLLLPEIKNGKVVFTKTVPITKLSIGISVHSGMAHSLVSVGDNIHLVWGEASDPKDKSIKGVPTFVASYDRKTGKLTKPVLIGFGPPANDVHNTPSIIADSQGYLHAVIGCHGDRFRYTRSIKPNDSSKWLPEKKIAEKTNMTYAGLLCDKDDNLYLFYREWPRFQPYGYCAVLAMRTKKAMDEKWSDYKVIAKPFFTDYSVYYHKVTMDPDQKKIYVSLQYFSTFWFFRNESSSDRTLIESTDGGNSWNYSKINL